MARLTRSAFVALCMIGLAWSPVRALEAGAAVQTKPGIFIGSSAGVPPPGIYMFNQFFTYQSNLKGPGTQTALGGASPGFQAAVDVQGFVFVPGWTFLGATYDAVLVQAFATQSFGSPINTQAAGVHNTYVVPIELSWNLGNSGIAVKTGLGIFAPDGTRNGPTGLGNLGAPYWTFQPELIVSYLKDGWNMSAAFYEEFNTANTITQYTSGSIFHADFTATKSMGQWTFGPVAYYYGQVSNDSCTSATCLRTYPTGTLGNASRSNVWAVGGLLGYNFGPAQLTVWATQEVSAKASNPAAVGATGADFSLVPRGFTALAQLNFRIWGPEESPKPTMFHK